jgi:HK97 family phage major capsid protein
MRRTSEKENDMTDRYWETREEGGDEPDQLAELRTAVEGFTQNAETRLTAVDTTLTDLRARLVRAETALNRPGGVIRTTNEQATEIEKRAFDHFLRRGREALDAIEIRTLRVSDDTAGGYLAPDQFVAELLRNVVLFSPVRSVARVASTSAAAVQLPKRTGPMTSTWVGETQPIPSTTITYGQQRYDVRELACYVDVSNQILEDTAFDLVAELAFDFAEEFGRAEGAAFVNGPGVLQPIGFMADDTVPYFPNGDANGLIADSLISLFYSIPAPYRRNLTWGMNARTLGMVRQLKTTTGFYLLDMAGIANTPVTTILGRPVVEMPDMPDVAPNAYPIIAGDFMNAYRIFDRVALSVLRDPYSQATNGLTRFHGRRRVAGGIALGEALTKLKMATS